MHGLPWPPFAADQLHDLFMWMAEVAKTNHWAGLVLPVLCLGAYTLDVTNHKERPYLADYYELLHGFCYIVIALSVTGLGTWAIHYSDWASGNSTLPDLLSLVWSLAFLFGAFAITQRLRWWVAFSPSIAIAPTRTDWKEWFFWFVVISAYMSGSFAVIVDS